MLKRLNLASVHDQDFPARPAIPASMGRTLSARSAQLASVGRAGIKMFSYASSFFPKMA